MRSDAFLVSETDTEQEVMGINDQMDQQNQPSEVEV